MTVISDAPARTFNVVTLGCSKNRVDSEGMEHLLTQRGLTAVPSTGDADAIVVNTCGFLGAARQESIDVISGLLAERREGQVLVAAGCLPALGDHHQELPAGVDYVLSTREWYRIGDIVQTLFGEELQPEVAGCEGMLTTFSRASVGPSAYVKIADGCDHNCAFCTIPSIKGRQQSKRPMHVLQEIIDLVAQGTKEIVLVAQDTIRYGADLGMKHGLPQLLESIVETVPNLPWVRMLYIYPSPLTLKMVDVLAQHDALLPYLDMPIQHADRDVLRAMNRPSNLDMTRRLIDHARATLAEPVMRTTLIVGYPGETEAQFLNLARFVEEQEFDHVGVFTYSAETGTKAAMLEDRIDPAEAEARRNHIMEIQQAISYRKNSALVGQILDVLIEGHGEAEDEAGNVEAITIGRARRHAPEVDGYVFLPGALPIGELMPLRIVEAGPYDLWAEAARSSSPGSRRPKPAVRARRRRLSPAARSREANRPERRGQAR